MKKKSSISKDTQALIWSYLDGDCSKRELDFVKKAIISDKEFKKEYERCVTLHKELGDAVRFKAPEGLTQKIINHLPIQVAAANPKELLSTRSWTIFAICNIIVLSVFYLFNNFYAVESTGTDVLDKYLPASDITTFLSSLGQSGLPQIFTLVFIAAITLFILDKFLARKGTFVIS